MPNKVLFVTTVPFDPPDDGVKIPAFQHHQALSTRFEVDCLLLHPEAMPNRSEQAFRERYSTSTKLIHAPRSPFVKSFLLELFGSKPFYANRCPDKRITESTYAAIWFATPPSLGAFESFCVKMPQSQRPIYIAGLSDLHSLVVKTRAQRKRRQGTPPHGPLASRIINTLRASFLTAAELNMLSKCDLITLQTATEQDWILQHAPNLAERLLLLPNTVDDNLFSLPLERHSKTILFAAKLNGVYRHRLAWFLNSVWPIVRAEIHDAVLLVARGAAGDNETGLSHRAGVFYSGYTKDLTELYKHPTIAVAPIYKGYGLINKVVEAMASGCIAIGDETAFNGIPDFKDETHGLVATDGRHFAQQILRVLKSPNSFNGLRARARDLTTTHFRSVNRHDGLGDRLSSLIADRSIRGFYG